MSSESGNYAARCGDILESSDDSDDEILSQYEPQPPKVSYESDQTQKTSPLKTAAEESAVTQSQGTKKRKRQSHFYGVYLLRSKAPQHPNSTYIGFTVNPQRRIRQHNGEVQGGAFKTSRKRPWEMVLVLHGFPSKVVALQFEWAWQQPLTSKAVRDAVKAARLSDRGGPNRKLRVLCEMLSCRPWSRYPLTLRFFASDAVQLLHGCRPLPPHVRTVHSSIDSLNVAANESSDEDSDLEEGWAESDQSVADGLRRVGVSKTSCYVCGEVLHTPYIKCGCGTKMTGQMRAHIRCLASKFVGAEDEFVGWVPDRGKCPACATERSWSEWIRLARYKHIRVRPIKNTSGGLASYTSASETDGDTDGDTTDGEASSDIQIGIRRSRKHHHWNAYDLTDCYSDGNTSDDEESLPVRLAFSQPASTESSEVTTTRPNERWRHRYGVGTLQLSTIDDDEGDDGCADCGEEVVEPVVEGTNTQTPPSERDEQVPCFSQEF